MFSESHGFHAKISWFFAESVMLCQKTRNVAGITEIQFIYRTCAGYFKRSWDALQNLAGKRLGRPSKWILSSSSRNFSNKQPRWETIPRVKGRATSLAQAASLTSHRCSFFSSSFSCSFQRFGERLACNVPWRFGLWPIWPTWPSTNEVGRPSFSNPNQILGLFWYFHRFLYDKK